MLSKRFRIPIQHYVGTNTPRPAKTIRGALFGVRIYRTTLPYARIGVVVSKSVDKRAVVRNHIRRTIIDAAQKQLATLPVADYIIMANVAAGKTTKDELAVATTKTLKSLL